MSGLVGDNTNQFASTMNMPDANAQGLLTSIYDIGCAVGCVLSFFVGERFGRKKMIIVRLDPKGGENCADPPQAGGTIMIIGTVLLSTSYGRAQFYVGRVVTGLGNGIKLDFH